MPTQIQLKPVKTVEIEPESAVPPPTELPGALTGASSTPGDQPQLLPGLMSALPARWTTVLSCAMPVVLATEPRYHRDTSTVPSRRSPTPFGPLLPGAGAFGNGHSTLNDPPPVDETKMFDVL